MPPSNAIASGPVAQGWLLFIYLASAPIHTGFDDECICSHTQVEQFNVAVVARFDHIRQYRMTFIHACIKYILYSLCFWPHTVAVSSCLVNAL